LRQELTQLASPLKMTIRQSLLWPIAGSLLLLRASVPLEGQPAAAGDKDAFPGPNKADEPLRAQFSWQAAAHFLDVRAVNWPHDHQCFSCHVSYAYLLSRPSIKGDIECLRQVRLVAEQAVERGGLEAKESARPSEAVLLAAALALNDAQTTHTLQPATREALDRIWTFQREDGAWAWRTNCQWPPSEIDEQFGVAVAALAVGLAPGDYRQTPQAQRGLEKIRLYFGHNPPANVYERGLLLWASRGVAGIQSGAQKKAVVAELLSLQRPDGGWAFASLGNWERADGNARDTQTSDGYGTGFALFALRQGGLSPKQAQLRKGINWLKTHQRLSGRWYTRSAREDNEYQYLTDEGTAFAVMALAACHEIP